MLAWLLGVGFAGCSAQDAEDSVDIGENPYDPDNTSERPYFRAYDHPHHRRVFGAVALYTRGRRDLERHEYSSAIKEYDKLISKYPFTDFATQGSLERIYCLYRGDQPDEAQVAADRFVREHPRHAEIDYVTYLRGLIDSSRDESVYELLPLENSGRDVDFRRRAFEDFALLVQRYPKSPYVGDARLRMIDLRNRIAEHDLAVARFYLRRGAYVASARRAQEVVQNYPGAPAQVEALKVMQQANDQLGLKVQAEQVQRLIAANADMKPVAVVAQNGNGPVVSDASTIRYAPAPRTMTDMDVAAAEKKATDSPVMSEPERPGFFSRVAESVGLKSAPPAPIANTAMSPSTETSHAALNSSVSPAVVPENAADTQKATEPASGGTTGVPPVTEAPHGFWHGVKNTFGLQSGGSAGSHPSAQSHGIVDRTRPPQVPDAKTQSAAQPDAAAARAAVADASDSGTPMTAASASVPETPAAVPANQAADTATAPGAAPSPPGGFWSGMKHTFNLQEGGGAATKATPQAHGIAGASDVSDRAQEQEKADYAAEQARARAESSGEPPAASAVDPGQASNSMHMHFLDRSSNANGPATPATPASHGVAPRVDVAAPGTGSDTAGAAASAEAPSTQPYPSAAKGIAPRTAPADSSVASASDPRAGEPPAVQPQPKPERGFFQRLKDFLFGP